MVKAKNIIVAGIAGVAMWFIWSKFLKGDSMISLEEVIKNGLADNVDEYIEWLKGRSGAGGIPTEIPKNQIVDGKIVIPQPAPPPSTPKTPTPAPKTPTPTPAPRKTIDDLVKDLIIPLPNIFPFRGL